MDKIRFSRLGRCRFLRRIAQNTVAHAEKPLRDSPFFQQRFALRRIKFLTGPVDPARSSADRLRRQHHIAQDQRAILQPCHSIPIGQNDTDGGRAVKGVGGYAHDFRIHAAERKVEQKKKVMVDLMKERKTHEILKERAFEQFLLDEKAEESKQIDQLTSYTYGRD